MKSRKGITMVLALAFAFAISVPMAHAGLWDDATQMSFTRSVELPGHVILQPGTYWFLRNGTDRSAVEVYDANKTKEVGMFETREVPRIPDDKTELTFANATADHPMMLVRWFNPGDQKGVEFVYSGGEGREAVQSPQTVVAAQATNEPQTTVPPSDGD